MDFGGGVAEVLHEAWGFGGWTQRREPADDKQSRPLGVSEPGDRSVHIAKGAGERTTRRERAHHHVRAGDE